MARSRLSMGNVTPQAGGIPIQANLGIYGIKETQEYLKRLPIDIRDKQLGKALKAAGNILRTEEVRLAPDSRRNSVEKRIYWGRKREGKPKSTRMVQQRGVLKKSLQTAGAIITRKNWDKHPIIWVGVTKGKYAKPYDAWYAHFFEFGTKERFHKSGKSTGRMKSGGYVEKSFANVYKRCIGAINSYFAEYFKKK